MSYWTIVAAPFGCSPRTRQRSIDATRNLGEERKSLFSAALLRSATAAWRACTLRWPGVPRAIPTVFRKFAVLLTTDSRTPSSARKTLKWNFEAHGPAPTPKSPPGIRKIFGEVGRIPDGSPVIVSSIESTLDLYAHKIKHDATCCILSTLPCALWCHYGEVHAKSTLHGPSSAQLPPRAADPSKVVECFESFPTPYTFWLLGMPRDGCGDPYSSWNQKRAPAP